MKSKLSRLAVLAIAVFAAYPALATNSPAHSQHQGQGQEQGQEQGQAQGQLQGQLQGQTSSNRNSNSNTNRVNASAGAVAGAAAISEGSTSSSQSAGGAASAEQGQSQTASADNAGNTQSLTFNEASLPSRTTIEARTVPTAIAPNIYPTASCAMAASAGASAMGWGASLGGTKVNRECVMLETARVFSQLGYPIQGLDVLCAKQTSLDVFGSREACLAGGALHEASPNPSVVVVPVGVSQKDVTTAIDRAFKAAAEK